MIIVTQEPIRPEMVYDLISTDNAGSVVFHYAIVKGDSGGDKATTSINYLENGDMSAEMEAISEHLCKSHSLSDVLLMRRIGTVAVGEIISLVAASSPSSADAFAACQQGISSLKQMVTLIKEEIFQ